MTDSQNQNLSHPQQQMPPTSYVDDYQPPADTAQNAAQNTAQNAVPNSIPASKSDPLAELEKLLTEYEQKKQQSIKQELSQDSQAENSPDSSSELGKLLQEHEAKNKGEIKVKTKSPASGVKTRQQAIAHLEKTLRQQGNPVKSAGNQSPTQSTQASENQQALQSLEKALQQYEAQKAQRQQNDQVKTEPNQPVSEKPPVSATKKMDPLEELETLLRELKEERGEERRPQVKPVESPQSVSPPPAIIPEPVKKVEPVAPQFKIVANEVKKQPQPPMTSTELQAEMNPDRATKPQSIPNSTPEPTEESPTNQSIDSQNIFSLLGVEQATDQEKEAFLDELQEAIWEDFLAKDLPLLVTPEELEEVRKLQQVIKANPNQQETLIMRVEQLVPDVEEIMFEKALELKQEMVWERVEGMKAYYVGNNEALNKVITAENHFRQGQWKSGTDILNGLTL